MVRGKGKFPLQRKKTEKSKKSDRNLKIGLAVFSARKIHQVSLTTILSLYTVNTQTKDRTIRSKTL